MLLQKNNPLWNGKSDSGVFNYFTIQNSRDWKMRNMTAQKKKKFTLFIHKKS